MELPLIRALAGTSVGSKPSGWKPTAPTIVGSLIMKEVYFCKRAGRLRGRHKPVVTPRGRSRTSSQIRPIQRSFNTFRGGPFPLDVRVESNDPPGQTYDVVQNNSLTGKRMPEIQLEFHFSTVLMVRDPARVFHPQAHFYWNVRWQYQFAPLVFPNPADAQWRVTAVAGGNCTGAGHASSGTPSDGRFTAVLISVNPFSCDDLASRSNNAVATVGNACRREFRRWESVDVRR